MYSPDRDAPDRLAKKRHVVCEKHEAQGQHPYSENRQEREDPAHNTEHTNWNANQTGTGLAELFKDAGDALWDFPFDVPECNSQHSFSLRHAVRSTGPLSACPHVDWAQPRAGTNHAAHREYKKKAPEGALLLSVTASD